MNPNPCAKCKIVDVEVPCQDPENRTFQGEHKHFEKQIQFCPLHAAAEEMVGELRELRLHFTKALETLKECQEHVADGSRANALIAKAEGK